MIHPAVSALAERNMTRARILSQIAAAAPAAPGPRRQQSRGVPPVVCLCGSTRFADEFNRQRKRLTYDGQIVLSIEIITTQARADDPQHADPALKARLDELHLRKIDLADYILVLNVGGYIGESTRSEIAYAQAHGKPVRYLHPPESASPCCGCGYADCSACAGSGWACLDCGDAYFGTAPDDGLCPGCRAVTVPAGDTR